MAIRHIGRAAALGVAITLAAGAAYAAGAVDGDARGRPLLAAGDAASDRDSYIRDQEGKFEQLGRELDRLGRGAGRKGAEAGRDAERSLREAWDEVKKQLQALRAAGIAGWKEGREAYEKSLRDYERARKDADIADL